MGDLILIPLALWSSIALRYGTVDIPVEGIKFIFILLPILTIPVFVRMGLYRAVIRYFDEKALTTILLGVTFSTFIITAYVVLTGTVGIPRSSLLIYWVFCVAYITVSRYAARGLMRQLERKSLRKQKVAIYGAGRAGLQTALSMISSPEYRPVLFFDDNKELWGTQIAGIRIYQPSKAKELMEEYECQQLLFAIPSVSTRRRNEIIKGFEGLGIQLKIIPGMSSIVDGKVKIEDIREVGVEDLLGREPVPSDESLIGNDIKEKVVLVTGAGGSIGSELCRQILKRSPNVLVLLEQNEFALYSVEKEFKALKHNTTIIPVLGDVLRANDVAEIVNKFKVETVYHAAAYKHVPLVEANIISGVLNNIFGTFSVLKACQNSTVKKFMLISTDKAVRPTNIMGATKRIAEMIVQSCADECSNAIYSMVRFGNVLASSGSVIPLFKEQIRAGGPVTVTHPEITRYFMTIPEAAELVLQAASMAEGKDLFVLDMGEPVKILDLAKNMIRLSGFTVRDNENREGDIEIKFIGLRPGEKLYEELLISNASSNTLHPRIMKAVEIGLNSSDVYNYLEKLKVACGDQNVDLVRTIVAEMVPDYRPSPLKSNAKAGEKNEDNSHWS